MVSKKQNEVIINEIKLPIFKKFNYVPVIEFMCNIMPFLNRKCQPLIKERSHYVRNSNWASYHYGLQKSNEMSAQFQPFWASRNSVSVNFNLFLGDSFWKKFSPKSLNSTGTMHRHYQHGNSCGISSCDRWKSVE